MDKRGRTGSRAVGKAAGVVLKKLAPGAPGTLRHLARHGDALVCVRYREDPASRQRITTVELVVDSRPARIAHVRIGWGDVDLRRKIMAAGGTWDLARKVWCVPAGKVRALKLSDHVLKENS